MVKYRLFYVLYMVMVLLAQPTYALETVFIEEITSPEIREKIKSGVTIVIIPTGGTEQNGQHMVTGKHNFIVRYTAGEIAKQLGNALVAPVVAYVPEGNIEPPEGHMKFAGTISLREETYSALLEDTAVSLKQHGFKIICFLGDSGGNQTVQKNLADKLNSRWKDSGVRVLHVSDYYGNNGQDAWVESLKLSLQTPSAHAAFEDTSELMAVDKNMVREELRGKYSAQDFEKTGSSGDSTLASAEYGKYLLNLKINAAVKQIKNAGTP